jgi:type II secretory pathway component GspD/PulD (secretin)
MNNQEASLDFSKKFIYFTVSVTQSTESGVNNNSGNSLNTSTINSTKNEQAVGIELKITPSINFNKNEVTLTIEPKISDRSSDAAVLDPAINPKTGQSLGNRIPIFETKQLKTTAKITSGNVLVLGGLLKQNNETKEQGIPILSNIPILGYLFKHKSKETTVTETVIFIKATIIDDNNPLKKYDRDLHQRISNDKSNFMN